jgi:CubicO group peptidase (beta-lactamase class C family)
MTRIATATAVVRLAEQGRLDLDGRISSYYPPLRGGGRPVTVWHLLGHSSGLANPAPVRWVYPAGSLPPDRAAFVERLLHRYRRLRSAPGTRVHYSNLGYLVLGELIARVTGTAHESYVHDELIRPLGMIHTGFRYEESGSSSPATGYQPRGLTPLLRAVLPAGIVAGRQGRYVAVLRHRRGLRRAARRCGRRRPARAAASAARMRRVAPRGGPLDRR